MSLYKFLGKGAAYGLGYTEGELLELDDSENAITGIKCLVNEVYADGQQKGNPTGRMIMADKSYSADYLVQSGVITPANSEDKKSWKDGTHINAIADENTLKEEVLAESQADARAADIKAKKGSK